MDLHNDNNVTLLPKTIASNEVNGINTNDHNSCGTISPISDKHALSLQSSTTSIPSRRLSSRHVIKHKGTLSINERCMQLVSKALTKEKRLRRDIETCSQDQSFGQRQIYNMQLKVQECQNIIGTATQLIRMIGDTYRSTAQNIR